MTSVRKKLSNWYWLNSLNSGPPPFSPLDIADLGLWLDANAGVTLDVSSNLQQINDQSGHNRNYVQATEAIRPALGTGNIMSGLNDISFTTGTKVLQRSDSALIQSRTGLTFVAVYKWLGISGTFAPIMAVQDNTGTTNARFAFGCASPNTSARVTARLVDGGSGYSATAAGALSDTNKYVHVARVNFASGSEAINVRINRTQTNGTAPPSGTTPATTSLLTEIGRFSPSGSQWYGHIGEIMGFTRYLSDSEVGQIEDYVLARWGV